MKKFLIKTKSRKVPDRRIITDRRTGGASTYSGLDRRKMTPRRAVDMATCIYCGRVYGNQSDLCKAASTIETTVECRAGICPSCSLKRFPQFYSDS